jgi:DnaK suppressor protein
MDPEILNELRESLLERRAKILAIQDEAQQAATEQVRQEGQDSLDHSSNEALESTHLRLRDREKKLVRKIDSALVRMGDGSYPFCDDCGDEIGERRLRARPVTTFCIDCKEEQEREESRAPAEDDED